MVSFGAPNARSHVLIVPREVLDGWNFLYLHIPDTEFALCLEGEKHRNRILITGVRLAHVIASDFDRVAFAPCAGEAYIGSAHNHPNDGRNASSCRHSHGDLRTFHRDARARIDVVICGADRYAWVRKKVRGSQSFLRVVSGKWHN